MSNYLPTTTTQLNELHVAHTAIDRLAEMLDTGNRRNAQDAAMELRECWTPYVDRALDCEAAALITDRNAPSLATTDVPTFDAIATSVRAFNEFVGERIAAIYNYGWTDAMRASRYVRGTILERAVRTDRTEYGFRVWLAGGHGDVLEHPIAVRTGWQPDIRNIFQLPWNAANEQHIR